MYLALTVFKDNDCTMIDRVIHFPDGRWWLAKAAEFLGRDVVEGDIVLGVRVDRIRTEDQIERAIERAMDWLDDQFMRGIISQDEYDIEVNKLQSLGA